MPALPLDEAGKYVAGAYVVFMALILIYVAIMAVKLQRIERELRELASFVEAAAGDSGAQSRHHPARPDAGARAQGSQSSSVRPSGSGGRADDV